MDRQSYIKEDNMPSVGEIVIGSVKKLIIMEYPDASKVGEESKRLEFSTHNELEAHLDDEVPAEFFTRFSDGSEQSGVCVNIPTDSGSPAYQLECKKCGKKYWTVGAPAAFMYGSNYHPACGDC